MFHMFRTHSSEGGAPSQTTLSTEQEYHFVEQPSTDFFCPVMYGLLLQPHLTQCCGNHLSQEAAARIQGEGGACPVCNAVPFNTVLNKHFLRQVNELHVFCRHEDRGCAWQGELSDLERHVPSCLMRDAPPMTELLELPVYVCEDVCANCTLTSIFNLDLFKQIFMWGKGRTW